MVPFTDVMDPIVLTIMVMALTGLSTADYNTTETPHGLIFEPMADIETISGHWKFITHINLTQFYDEFDYVAEIINKTTEQCFTSQIYAHYHTEDFCIGLTAQLSADLNEIIESNKYFLHSRQKRGLVNVIGHGLKFLFGTMDASDAETHEQQFRHLISKGQKAETNILQQKTYLESTVSKLNETDNILNQHSLILGKLDDELRIFKQNRENDGYYNQATSMFTQLINYASILINKIRRDQNKLFDITFSSRQGMIHDSLFNPTEVLKQMQHIHYAMENQKFPFIIDASNLYQILNTGEFNAAQINNILIFEIKIPLFRPQHFKLYNIVAVPNSEGDNIFSFIQPEYAHLAISTTTNQYFPMDPLALSTDCKTMMNNQYICKPPGQIYKTYARMNCELSIFTQTTHRCTETKRKLSGEVWVWLIQPNKFLYILPEPISIKIKCIMEISIVLKGIGILTTNGCNVETPKMVLSGFNNTSTILESNIQKINYIHLPLIGPPLQNTTWSSPALPSIKSIQLLDENKFKLEDEEENLSENSGTINVTIIIIIAILIFALYYFAGWLWFKGAKSVYNQTRTI